MSENLSFESGSETPNDSAAMFSVKIDDKAVGQNLTAVETYLVVFQIMERVDFTRPRS
jgi:hypothetical protein